MTAGRGNDMEHNKKKAVSGKDTKKKNVSSKNTKKSVSHNNTKQKNSSPAKKKPASKKTVGKKQISKNLWRNLAIGFGAAAAVYVLAAVFFSSHFFLRTEINGYSCQFKNVEQVKEKLLSLQYIQDELKNWEA